MIFDKYPYTNFHEMNDDWVIQTLREFEKQLDEFVTANSLTYADPIEYDPATSYPAHTVVIYQETAYVSKQVVPANLPPTADSNYWLLIFPFGEIVDSAVDSAVDNMEEQINEALTAAQGQLETAINSLPTLVNNWMTAHPDVVSAVPYNSINWQKLNIDLQSVILADYYKGSTQNIVFTEQGGLNHDNGAEYVATQACRTELILFPVGVMVFATMSGYQVSILQYDADGAYIGYTSVGSTPGFVAVAVADGEQYRFEIITDEMTDITPAGLPFGVLMCDPYEPAYLHDQAVSEENVTLPNTIKGKFKLAFLSNADKIICGTENVAQLLNIKEGTFTVRNATFTVSGNTVQISGTPSASVYYSLVDGDHVAPATLGTMTLPLPTHRYTLSEAVTGTGVPTLCIRSKSNSNIVTAQNNTAQFDMDPSTCGGAYILLNSGVTYNCTVKIAVLPYNATNGDTHREQDSSVTVYTENGSYDMDGYAWSIGDPSIVELKSKMPRKPLCKYSTRTIPYSSMTECLDIYIPAKRGYINYVFGHTVAATPTSEGGGDVWRLVQVDAVNDALAYQFHITQLGETEMAIQISGRNDFIGGTTHGDEVMVNNSLRVALDGKFVNVTTITNETEFDLLQIFLVSNMFDPNDHTSLVGVHGREWRFDKTGLLLSQTVEFKENLTLDASYMPMLSVIRGNDTASALQVTDTYVDDGNFMPYDVSSGGFTTYPNQLKNDVRNMFLFGETSGVEASLEIIEQPDNMNRQGTYLYNVVNTYNKLYCCICGYGNTPTSKQNVNAGDKWHVKSKIRFDLG